MPRRRCQHSLQSSVPHTCPDGHVARSWRSVQAQKGKNASIDFARPVAACNVFPLPVLCVLPSSGQHQR
ncbi:hypothetical protein DICSQDRAFT_157712 [Dichomitus squalens LYAD-421 SS1]|uniref:Uncharacterized protein n=1 Tax=Dichomitus squalens (strain LYAD-421) TaxID=732165 RepID=R7SKV7_DICSQ|nr:uncharacterized protein DICSQDRAFT_157712 [Dichomitus squalens LYAD-421 SS1]EJF56786.1 hypothetical protein DICSQDRAFT_157712 [Dichomitus squalens LYAD-421 SS1]